MPVTCETAITRRLREPTAREIVLIALPFLKIFLLISNNHKEKEYDNYQSTKEYQLMPTGNNFKKLLEQF